MPLPLDLAGPLNLLSESNEMEVEGVDSELRCPRVAVRGGLGSPEDRKISSVIWCSDRTTGGVYTYT